jgi:hypothetical protein
VRGRESAKRFPNTIACENTLSLRKHLKAFRIDLLNLKIEEIFHIGIDIVEALE